MKFVCAGDDRRDPTAPRGESEVRFPPLALEVFMPLSARRLLALGLAVCALVATLTLIPSQPTASAQEQPYHPELVVVAFEPGTNGRARANEHARHRGRVENHMAWANLDVVRVPRGQDPAEVAAKYRRHPKVSYASPNWQVSLEGIPNDTLFSDQWGLHNTGQPVTGSFVQGVPDIDIDGPEGWDAAYGTNTYPTSGGTRVGILDSGIDLTHADLLGKTKACASAVTGLGIVTEGACSDDNAHGTHVAGTVAALTNNGLGVAGSAPNAELAIFKALNGAGVGFYADIIAGIHWLHTTGQARIINMSIGGGPQDAELDRELTEAANAGVLLVAAAGNDGDDTRNWPAYHPDVMSVGSVNQAGQKSDFSNCNNDVEIAAPGEDIWSTAPGNGYVVFSGTSMASPHVAGVASVVMWKLGLDADATRARLKSTTEDSGGCNGTGVVNLARALGVTPP